MDESSTYHLLREFSASWWLVAMMAFFVGIVLFTLRPGSKRLHDDIARIPFRHDEEPKE